MKFVKEQKHRLPHEFYTGYTIVSYTKCVKNRKPLFTEQSIFKVFEEYLLKELINGECDAFIYLFMPDHAHFLISGKSHQADSLKVMYRFSQRTGDWLSKHKPSFRWQKDFYDHILRKEDVVEKHVRYILENPIRKNIVNNWKKYPFKGSTVYRFDEWIL